MKRITNTINNDIEVIIGGEVYRLPAGGFIDVPASVAEYWVTNLHTFLNVSDVKSKEVKEVVEEVSEEKESVIAKVKKTIKK